MIGATKVKVCLAAAIFVAGAYAQAAPQAVAAARDRVIGEVTGTDLSGGRISLKTDKGEAVAVVVNDKTVYLRVPPGEKDLKKAAKMAPSEITAGDRLYARGQFSEDHASISAASVIVMTKADLAQKREHDRAEWTTRGITGVITAVDAQAKEFTVSVRTREGVKPVVVENAEQVDFRRYAPDSVRFSDAKPSSFAELKTGDHVRVLGDKNPDGTRIKPQAIVSGSFRDVAGTILAVDAAAGEIRITDLETKKPLTVRVNSDSNLRRLAPMAAAMLARMVNGGAGAAGERPGGARPPQAGSMPAGLRAGGAPGAMGAQNRNVDFQTLLERMPALSLSELKQGDAVIISSTAGADPSRVTAITLVAGVEPLLTAAPRGSQVGGMWNFDMGLPQF
ncbi:MAG: hypothetical protein M1541_03345 [Acidobacteria bacterium]|nr:hypothetical protein [Acidobacteriota bacterium]